MLIIKNTVETSATPNQIWAFWQDPESWGKWDNEIEVFQLNGPFQSGTSGYLKMKDSPRLKFVLTRVETNKMFVQETKLLLARAISTQSMSKVADKTFVTFQVDIKGPLALLYTYLLGGSIKKKIPVEMEMMKKHLKEQCE